MPLLLSPADLSLLIDETDAAARRLHRKLRLPPADLDDLRQDLLLDLLRRLPAFDVSRGSIGAFANTVLRHQSARIAMRHHRQRQAAGGSVLSLDVPAAGGTEPLGHRLTEADGLAAWHGQDQCAAADAELHCDLARVLDALSTDAHELCAGLATCRPSELAALQGISSSALYRRLAQLRLAFAMRGLTGRWDSLVTA